MAAEEESVTDEPALIEAPACPIPAPKEGLSGFEKAELLAIGVLIPALFAATQGIEWSLSFGALVAYSAGVVLGQGLVRDLARLAVVGRKEPTERLLCLCAESTIGLAGLGAGTLLLAIGIRDTVTLSSYSLTAIVGGILALGFVAKDYVLIVRKVKDHGTIAVG